MSVYVQNPLDDDDKPQSLIGPVLTALTIAAAGVLYLVTHHPLLAGILPWLHGGWSTFSTGLWILRSDPVRPRARVCFLFYLAAACWKAAIAALATVLVLIFFADKLGGFRAIESHFSAVMIAMIAGLIMNTAVATTAVLAALKCKVRICVRTNLRAMLRNDLSRAAYIGPSPQTRLSLGFAVVATAVLVPLAIIGVLLMVAMMALDGAFHGQPVPMNTVETTFIVIGMLITVFGVPLSSIPLLAWLSPRVIAKSPRECWPEGTV